MKLVDSTDKLIRLSREGLVGAEREEHAAQVAAEIARQGYWSYLAEQAQFWQEQGLPVLLFALHEQGHCCGCRKADCKGKHPLYRPDTGNGASARKICVQHADDASCDPQVLRTALAEARKLDMRCGLAGKLDGRLLVLDVDDPAQAAAGLWELPGLRENPPLLQLSAPRAGGQGCHLIYRLSAEQAARVKNAGCTSRSTAGAGGVAELAGIQVLLGGLLVLAPTMHASGARYFAAALRPEVPAAPDALLNWLLSVLPRSRSSYNTAPDALSVTHVLGEGGEDIDHGGQMPSCSLQSTAAQVIREEYYHKLDEYVKRYRDNSPGTSWHLQTRLVAHCSFYNLNPAEGQHFIWRVVTAPQGYRRPQQQMLRETRERLNLHLRGPQYGFLNASVPAALVDVCARLRSSSKSRQTRTGNVLLLILLAAQEGYLCKRQRGGRRMAFTQSKRQLTALLLHYGVYPPTAFASAKKATERCIRRLQRGWHGVRLEQLDSGRWGCKLLLHYAPELKPEQRIELSEAWRRCLPELAEQGLRHGVMDRRVARRYSVDYTREQERRQQQRRQRPVLERVPRQQPQAGNTAVSEAAQVQAA